MSEHWYTKTGESAYETNGRATTLRDARKLGLVPSVTTVLGVIAKPALTTWMVNQGIMAALTGTRRDGETDAQYVARILADSKQQAIDAANEGTRIHDACETFVRDGHCRDEYLPHATAAKEELARLFPGVTDWVVEQSFAHSSGFGGKCDLHSPSTGIIADYKTKDGDFSDGKKLGYDQHWQLAAYQVGLCLDCGDAPDAVWGGMYNHTQGAAIFISRTHPGAVASCVWTAQEMAQGWSIFETALRLWQLQRDYTGAF